MPTAFITGANRGLGLEFVKQLTQRGDTVYAACRNPDDADDLKQIGGDVHILALDAADPQSIRAAADQVSAKLDLLVNNAGIYGPKPNDKQTLGVLDAAEMTRVLQTNTVGPLMIAQALADKLADGAKVLNMSTGYASIANAGGGWPTYYSTSKAALNMATKILAAELKKRNVTAIAINPGHVKTRMGGDSAPLTPEKSISGMLEVADKLTVEDAGKFLDYRGREGKF